MKRTVLLTSTIICAILYSINGFPTEKDVPITSKKLYENPDMVEGDMIFPTSSELSGRGVAARGSSVPWTNGIVPYEISSVFASAQQSYIISTMQKMERIISINNSKCIQFRPRNASDIYYITIINGAGCYSYVGQNTGITMTRTVSLQHPGCVYEAIIMHELLHTLGFYHEQSRPDRDSYVRVNYGNIQSGTASNFDKYDNTMVNTLNTPYDYASVMHYERTAFSTNGLATIEPLQANISIGQRYNMSTIDIEEVRIFYNCSSSGQTFPPMPTTTTVNLYTYNTTVSSILTSNSQRFTRYGSTSVNGFYYDAYLVNVSSNGYYIFTSNSAIDTYGYLYSQNFVSTSPSLNLITFDDDTGGYSQFKLEIYLQPNITYILVATTYSVSVSGSYSVTGSGLTRVNIFQTNNTAIITVNTTTTAAPNTTVSSITTSNYSSSLTTNSPRYDRSGSNTNILYYYQSIQLSILTSGSYSFRSVSNIDSYGYLYLNTFDPTNPTVNQIALNDDGAGNNQFLITYPLQMSNRYILVFTTFSTNQITPFTIIATGPGRVDFFLYNFNATTQTTTTRTTATTTTQTTTTTTSRTTATTTSQTTVTTTSQTTTTVTTATTTTGVLSSGTLSFSMKFNLGIIMFCFFIILGGKQN